MLHLRDMECLIGLQDTRTDGYNCGACGLGCYEGSTCCEGTCVVCSVDPRECQQHLLGNHCHGSHCCDVLVGISRGVASAGHKRVMVDKRRCIALLMYSTINM